MTKHFNKLPPPYNTSTPHYPQWPNITNNCHKLQRNYPTLQHTITQLHTIVFHVYTITHNYYHRHQNYQQFTSMTKQLATIPNYLTFTKDYTQMTLPPITPHDLKRQTNDYKWPPITTKLQHIINKLQQLTLNDN